jgi:uncharacterized protein YqhQ
MSKTPVCKNIIGGQAVIEGVLMKNKDKIAIAVRKENRKISVKKEKYKSITKKYKFLGWPFFRGSIVLFEMMIVGMKALTFSANESLGEEEEKLSGGEIFFTISLSMLLAIGLFFMLPLFLTSLIKNLEGVLFHLVDGLFRVGIVILYMVSISFLRDVRRLFEYHGAEHKAVNCYEAGKPLTVKNVKPFTTLNSRCGTSFIFYVLVVSVLVFSLVPYSSIWVKLLSRILLLPVIAGLSYELLKFSDKHKNIFLFKMLIAPGLLMQKITTKEPNEKQIEIAIRALKEVL